MLFHWTHWCFYCFSPNYVFAERRRRQRLEDGQTRRRNWMERFGDNTAYHDDESDTGSKRRPGKNLLCKLLPKCLYTVNSVTDIVIPRRKDDNTHVFILTKHVLFCRWRVHQDVILITCLFFVDVMSQIPLYISCTHSGCSRAMEMTDVIAVMFVLLSWVFSI